MLDQLIEASGMDAEPAEPDPLEEPFDIEQMANLRALDLKQTGIATVIWATGFGGDFEYLDVDLPFDEAGEPVHDDGCSPIEGIYFLGLPWLRNRASGLIAGAADDAVTSPNWSQRARRRG